MNASTVRSALFVPATRPDRILKAISAGADRVIVDLEDAVQENLKEQARDNLGRFLSENPHIQILVRVNAPNHWAHIADLDLCRRNSSVAAILLPKAESAAHVSTARQSGKPIWPIIESAKGLSGVNDIAHSEGVERLSFGSLDLGLDMGLTLGTLAAEHIFNQARYAVLLSSRVAGLAPALDSVFPAINDNKGLQNAVQFSRDMGFGGSLCIHPNQVAIIHQTLEPNADELRWAERVMEGAASGKGVFVLDGQMIDLPVIARAQAILVLNG